MKVGQGYKVAEPFCKKELVLRWRSRLRKEGPLEAKCSKKAPIQSDQSGTGKMPDYMSL